MTEIIDTLTIEIPPLNSCECKKELKQTLINNKKFTKNVTVQDPAALYNPRNNEFYDIGFKVAITEDHIEISVIRYSSPIRGIFLLNLNKSYYGSTWSVDNKLILDQDLYCKCNDPFHPQNEPLITSNQLKDIEDLFEAKLDIAMKNISKDYANERMY